MDYDRQPIFYLLKENSFRLLLLAIIAIFDGDQSVSFDRAGAGVGGSS